MVRLVAGVIAVANEVETGEAGVDVEARDAEGMIMIPEVTGPDVVVIPELRGESAWYISPLRANHLILTIGRIEKLRIAVELVICVTTMQVRNNRNAVRCYCVGFVARERVAPVHARINRE